MNKTEILEHLMGVKEGEPLSEKDQSVIDAFAKMEQKERMHLFMDIIDEPEIDLMTEVMQTFRVGYEGEFIAIRKAVLSGKGTTNDNETAVERAYESLNNA
jgi:hypothetical protein